MNRPGLMVYKCRRCAATFRPIGVPDLLDGLFSAMRGTTTPVGTVHLLALHACDGGATGIADLIGGEPDEVTP